MKAGIILLLLYVLPSIAHTQLVPQHPKNVAIFLYEGVELLDFAGPGEVFSAAGFNTYTVSVDGAMLTSQRFVKIDPQYSIFDSPAPDIIVVPGGNSGSSANDPRVIEWIVNSRKQGTQFMSVCTGAFILAKAGLLDNKRATTHWGSINSLAASYPKTTVMKDTRWIDNGFVITTAGVSAGIDGALHYVSKLKGLEVALKVARYMEYDKWDHANGVVDVENEYLNRIIHDDQKTGNKVSQGPIVTSAPYQGEFLNLANKLILKEDNEKATTIVEEGIRLYPESEALYKLLGILYRKSGKPTPVSEEELVRMIRDGKADEAIARYEKDKQQFAAWRIYSENEIKDAAYFLLLDKKNVEGAIKIFQFNLKVFPNSADAYDSLGEAYLLAGKEKEGIECYKTAASMGYENAKKVLARLGVQ